MNIQEQKQLVMDGYREFQRGDIQNLLNRFHEDAEWASQEVEFVPFSGNYHGRQEIAQFYAKLDAAAEPVRFDIKQMVAEGDQVIVSGESSWRARSTGRSYDTPWVHVFTLRDGKVARFESYYDTAACEKAFHPEQSGQAPAAAQLHH